MTCNSGLPFSFVPTKAGQAELSIYSFITKGGVEFRSDRATITIGRTVLRNLHPTCLQVRSRTRSGTLEPEPTASGTRRWWRRVLEASFVYPIGSACRFPVAAVMDEDRRVAGEHIARVGYSRQARRVIYVAMALAWPFSRQADGPSRCGSLLTATVTATCTDPCPICMADRSMTGNRRSAMHRFVAFALVDAADVAGGWWPNSAAPIDLSIYRQSPAAPGGV